MDAAVLHQHGATPRFGDFAEPAAGPGHVVIEVTAAALHHFDLHKATGTFYTGPPPLPSVVGTDGVGLAGARRVYFDTTVAPHGSMAERAVAPEEALLDLPEGIEDAVAAAIGNPGMAAWLALAERARLQEGETVLVLGATGATGNIAVQAARILGAGRVVAAGRPSERLERMRERGADAVVELDRGDPTAAIREATGGGADVTIDMLWGEPALAAMRAAAPHARHVQVGNVAGASIALDAPAIRSLSLDVRGFSHTAPPREARRAAYLRVAEHVRRGEIAVDVHRVPLADVASAWERQRSATGGAKIVLIPEGRSSGR